MKTFTLLLACTVCLAQNFQYNSIEKNTQCFDELGCFPITKDFFHPIWRNINNPVESREQIAVTFLFFTRKSPANNETFLAYKLNLQNLKEDLYNASNPTKMIVHGFLDNQYFGEWMGMLKDELLKVGDFNVIIVDWSGGNSFPYSQATANTRVVGAEMALLIGKLQKQHGIDPKNVHLYGHSLGAHIVGYAGKHMEGNIGRITAMDAAQPYFQYLPKSVRLDKSDAKFVEAIHTDCRSFVTALGLGYSEPFAHIDFYPNGGEIMTGCNLMSRFREIQTDGVRGMTKFSACNHMKSVAYTKEFLVSKNNCVPIAFECENYELFKRGHCFDCGTDGSRCSPVNYDSMDYYAKFANASRVRKMYFDTTASGSYCLFTYNVQLKLRRNRGKSAEVASSVTGRYELFLNGGENSEKFLLQPSVGTLVAGSTSSILIETATNLGTIKSVDFKYSSNSLFGSAMELESIRIIPMNTVVNRLELKKIIKTVCPSEPLKSRTLYRLTTKNCH